MRKPSRTIRRNIILFAFAILFLGALIAYVSVTRKPALIMPPETPEELAMRTSPDNAYFILEEAVKLIPKGPEPLVGPDPDYPQFQTVYKPERGSLGEALLIKRPDDDPEVVKFIDACGPVIEKTREALSKPFYREPVQWSEFEVFEPYNEKRARAYSSISTLGTILIARGVQTQRVTGDGVAAANYIMDALRLGALLATDGDNPRGFGIQREALSRLGVWAHSASKEPLSTALTNVLEREHALKPPVTTLEFQWRVLDNTARFELPIRTGPPTFVTGPLFSWGLASARRLTARNRDEFRRVVGLNYPEFVKWRKDHSELLESNFGMRAFGLNPLHSLISVMRSYTSLRVSYNGAIANLALELYRQDHDAYPESLDPLVPKYLDQLPKDPYTGGPFMYRREQNDYRLYSLGENGQDDGGTPRGHDDQVVHAPPDPDK